jgi:hypothetical protein
MRLPDSEFIARPWRVHAITRGFRLEDVWALPTPGTSQDFPRLITLMGSSDLGDGSPLVRLLFAIRWKLGGLLGWDKTATGPGRRVPTLRDRLPEDLRGTAPADVAPKLPFTPLYLTHDEYAAEIANETMHGVLHLGWAGDRAQMAVLVRPNGRLGELYMAAIRPFRHAIVYPAMLRRIDKEWQKPRAHA